MTDTQDKKKTNHQAKTEFPSSMSFCGKLLQFSSW